MRPDIQALRGVAVTLVVVGHLWPAALPGGFTGVDVFFVISGFLITGQLQSRRLTLKEFWVRRARRILPAALSVLLVCAVATLTIVPETRWAQFLADIRASALYIENWHLAGSAVDYFASEDGPSLVQHCWSLSVEEQFYLLWPLALLVGRRAPAATMAVIALASLAYSIHITYANPAAAYFVTPARAWEFAAGGLLALLPASRPRPFANTAGLAAITLAAAFYGAGTPFPGVTALLPVAGALAVLWANVPRAFPPLVFLGGISYSVYLWHWPLLVLAPYATGAPVDTPTTLTVLMLSLLLGWLTKLAIEDPARSSAFKPRWTFACAGAATLALLGARRLRRRAPEQPRACR